MVAILGSKLLHGYIIDSLPLGSSKHAPTLRLQFLHPSTIELHVSSARGCIQGPTFNPQCTAEFDLLLFPFSAWSPVNSSF